MARTWSAFGFMEHEQMRAGGHLDADGWPLRVPPGADFVASVILTDLDASDTSIAGRYRLFWDGEGEVNVWGRAANPTRGTRWLEFDFTPGSGIVDVRVSGISATNPIKNIRCVKTQHLAAFNAGAIFRPEWLDLVRNFRCLRFMDWQATNDSRVTTWQSRARPASTTWATDAPVEVMVALANEIQIDPWFCIPHGATDDYISRFSTLVRDNLNPRLKAYFELSNEVWNWQFQQAHYANQQALRLWPDLVNGNGWMQWHGGRSAEMAMILDRVFDGQRGRYVKVIATQTGYQGIEDPILNAPRWVAMQAGRRAPKAYFDAYAVTGYWDGGFNSAGAIQRIQEWRRDHGEEGAMQRMREQMLDGRHLGADGSIAAHEAIWAYQKRVADAAGLKLVMYEGGSHLVPAFSGAHNNADLMGFLERFHYSRHMGELYTHAMTRFDAAGGEFFNAFVEIDRPSRDGFWGARRHVADDNPRWQALVEFNRIEPQPEPEPVTPPAPPPVVPVTPTPQPVPPAPQPPAQPSLAGMLGFAIPDGELLAGGEPWMDRIAALNAKTVRFDVRLERVQPVAGGGYQWANTDRLVDGLVRRGIKPLILLNTDISLISTAAGRTRFRQFAEAAVHRYGDRCKWWEVLNEANHTTLTPEAYAELLRIVYPAIKAIQRDSVVIYVGNASIPSTTAPNVQGAVDYLRRTYARLNGTRAFDAVGHHPYQYPLLFNRTDSWTGLGVMRSIRTLMNQNGHQDMLIWITEAGAPTSGGNQAVSQADQAETLRQLVDMARAPNSGLGPIHWYGFRDRATGTDTETYFGIEDARGTPKAAAAVFRELA
ncbi:MAG: hypothetical protein FJX25_05895 [Alphaproteobacteria bacterium]|nr:hypothetical protein [Alphaproteobacteria bacterium]